MVKAQLELQWHQLAHTWVAGSVLWPQLPPAQQLLNHLSLSSRQHRIRQGQIVASRTLSAQMSRLKAK